MHRQHANNIRRWTGAVTLVAFVWAATVAWALPDPETNLLFTDGVVLQRKAEKAVTTSEAVSYLMQAIDHFTQATQFKTDHCQALQHWSIALLQLAKLSTDPKFRQTQLRAASDRFTETMRCADSDWVAYFTWAFTLRTWIADQALSADERRFALDEAVQTCTLGLTRARFDSQRAKLENERAICMTGLAEITAEPDARLSLYKQARASFQSVEGIQSEAGNVTALAMFGVTLLQLGKLNNDPALLRQAAEKLHTATELAPAQAEPFYNLACTYSLLGQTDEALRSLRRCLENDASGTFAKEARNDADLKTLRDGPDFQQVVRPQGKTPEADQFFAAGLESQDTAEKAPFVATALDGFQKACAQYDLATQRRPEFTKAHLNWAHCLVRLAERAPDPAARRKLFATAQQRYEIAARIPNGAVTAHYVWGNLLVHDVDKLAADTDERREILGRALRALERGLDLAPFTRDRAALELLLGSDLGMLAALTDDLAQKRKLYTQALARFEAAHKTDPAITSVSTHKSWGTILMEFSKLDNDRTVIRQAVEQFKTTLDGAPGDFEARYNLACLYARLNQLDFAWRHLHLCLANDPQKLFRKAAVKDPDLRSLRNTPEFEAEFPRKFPEEESGKSEAAEKK